MYTPEQNLQLANLVSRGVKMADAKKKLGLDKVDAELAAKAKAEKTGTPPQQAPVAKKGEDLL